ncbi:hypothetical protein [Alteriqipengyuania sp. 357]
MSRRGWGLGLGALLAIGLSGAGCAGTSQASPDVEGKRFGLLTSLPIYRAPQASVADALSNAGQDQPHWLRTELEARNTLHPLDTIDAAGLEGTDILLLIQPRALTPAENVALDTWVREGGQVLLVADPMLVSEPHFALGDPRNPQAIAVTGPIEARWGLELQPGKSGDEAERQVRIGEGTLPVALGGSFVKRAPAGGDSADCELRYEGLVSVCAIGEGSAVLIADATLFEGHGGSGDAAGSLWSILGMFGDAPAHSQN